MGIEVDPLGDVVVDFMVVVLIVEDVEELLV